jgi:hypothetical protein
MTARNPDARRARCGMTSTEIRDAATDLHKHCSWCGEFKPMAAFFKQKNGLKGRTEHCRACWASYISDYNRREAHKEWRHDYIRRDHVRRYTRLKYIERQYGEDALPLEERRLAGYPCDVCHSDVHVGIDHCHNGGGNRGLLCRKCNLALGYMDDDPARLRALADYLDRYQRGS